MNSLRQYGSTEGGLDSAREERVNGKTVLPIGEHRQRKICVRLVDFDACSKLPGFSHFNELVVSPPGVSS